MFFDPDAGIVADPDDATELFGRLMRRLIRIMQERTADGYVFRTDLRLRPDPGSTPLAVPVEAALIYYEGRGQNWERAAYIKARPIAGDLSAGEWFLRQLVPFVFRKYLITRRSPTSIRSSARSMSTRVMARLPSKAMTSNWTRRHSRDRVLCPDPAIDRWWAACRPFGRG